MTASRPSNPAGVVDDACCVPATPVGCGTRGRTGAQWVRPLAWVSVATILTEDVLGLWLGQAAG
ncbi:MAG: hypothetical protein ACRDU4_17650, partial [Mycobacterium sp.]